MAQRTVSASGRLVSIPFKSTPEWQDLMRNPDVEISVVFHSEGKADLYANDELHSSIDISECDQTDIYSRRPGNGRVLEYQGTARRRMTIMSQKVAALQGAQVDKVAPQYRREASHLDSKEVIASKMLTAGEKGGENGSKRKKTRAPKEAEPKGGVKKRKKGEVRCRYVKLVDVPVDASIVELMTFLKGLDIDHVYACNRSADGKITVYVACNSPEVAGLAIKRSGESILCVKKKASSSSSGSNSSSRKTTKVPVRVESAPLAEAAWAKGIGAQLDGGDESEGVGAAWEAAVDDFERLCSKHMEGARDDESMELTLTVPGVVRADPATLVALFLDHELPLPHPDSIYDPVKDGMLGGGRADRVSSVGTFENREVLSMMQPKTEEERGAGLFIAWAREYQQRKQEVPVRKVQNAVHEGSLHLRHLYCVAGLEEAASTSSPPLLALPVQNCHGMLWRLEKLYGRIVRNSAFNSFGL